MLLPTHHTLQFLQVPSSYTLESSCRSLAVVMARPASSEITTGKVAVDIECLCTLVVLCGAFAVIT